jgi:hypothetical protein
VASNDAGQVRKGENTMSAIDTKNAAAVFNNAARRSRGHGVAVAGALLIAGYLGAASLLINSYERPDVSIVMARV